MTCVWRRWRINSLTEGFAALEQLFVELLLEDAREGCGTLAGLANWIFLFLGIGGEEDLFGELFDLRTHPQTLFVDFGCRERCESPTALTVGLTWILDPGWQILLCSTAIARLLIRCYS